MYRVELYNLRGDTVLEVESFLQAHTILMGKVIPGSKVTLTYGPNYEELEESLFWPGATSPICRITRVDNPPES